jgi:hypothetical protein
MHRPFGEQFEDGGAHVAAPAPAAPAAASAAPGSEAEAAARIESELESAARPEAEVGLKSGAEGVVGGPVLAKVLAELASSLSPLLMEGASVTGSEAEATGRWCEWVGHVCVPNVCEETPTAFPIC